MTSASLLAEPAGAGLDVKTEVGPQRIAQIAVNMGFERIHLQDDGNAASARRASAGSDLDPVFFMISARWFSTVRWLMPRSAAIFLLG